MLPMTARQNAAISVKRRPVFAVAGPAAIAPMKQAAGTEATSSCSSNRLRER